jgi:DNA-binding HxlR family transcriptional regulator
MPDYRKNKIHCENFRLEIEITIELLSGKWIVLLLTNLAEDKIVRFNEFRKNFPDITQKVLSQQLKKLEDYGIVQKEIYNETPPKVEYRLTKIGEDLIPLLEQMHSWGEKYIQQRNETK